METWQLCPKCKGSKNHFVTPLEEQHCNICDGTGIISMLNGLPPNARASISHSEINKKPEGAFKSIGIKPNGIDPISECPVDYAPPKLNGRYDLNARSGGFSKFPLTVKIRELQKPLNPRRNYTVPFLKEYIKNQIFGK